MSELTKAIVEARRDLIAEYPLLAQISAPSKDKDAFIPIHAGAAAYFEGDQKTFFDKYGDQIFYGSMLLGTLTSLFAAIWRFMVKAPDGSERLTPLHLYALTDQISKAHCEADLSEVERNIDAIVKSELEKYGRGEAEPADVAALGLATHRLEHLIAEHRSSILSARATGT